MSTTPYPGPDEVIIPSRIYFDEGKRIDVKVWPKTIQLTGPTKDLNKVFKTLEEYDDWWHQFKKRNPTCFPRFGLRQISITQILWINHLSNSLLLLLQNSISKNTTNG